MVSRETDKLIVKDSILVVMVSRETDKLIEMVDHLGKEGRPRSLPKCEECWQLVGLDNEAEPEE